MNEYFTRPYTSYRNIEVAEKFGKQLDLTRLKEDVDKLDIDKLETVPTYLNN